MDENRTPKLCPLCQRHRRMQTVDGLQFWIEWGEDGKPRLVTDALTVGGVHTLCVEHCPLCGEALAEQAGGTT